MPDTHPLYRVVEKVLQGDPTPRQLERLADILENDGLPIPLDLSTALMAAGHILPC